MMTFSEALELLKQGKKLRRTGWNGKGMWVELQRPDLGSKMNLPYLYLTTPNEPSKFPYSLVPWLASQTDILAEDWEIAA